MNRRKALSLVAIASIVGLSAIDGRAFAHGGPGHRGGGGGSLALLARAAGLSRSQIVSAFKNDSNLQTDRSNLSSARDAVNGCLVSGQSCTSQISAYTSALQALTQERMTVWAKLFQGAPNPQQAASVLSQLQQLRAEQKQIFEQSFGSGSSNGGSTPTPESGGSTSDSSGSES
jgi:hypothetical protein